jgi:hypothetical protein
LAPKPVRNLCSENRLIHCVDPLDAAPVFGGYRYQYTDDDLAELRETLIGRAFLLHRIQRLRKAQNPLRLCYIWRYSPGSDCRSGI